jgi:hypothetical protein
MHLLFIDDRLRPYIANRHLAMRLTFVARAKDRFASIGVDLADQDR